MNAVGTPGAASRSLRTIRVTFRVVARRVVTLLAVAFLVLPAIVIVGSSFNEGATLRFPPSGFSLRWYESFLSDASWRSSIATSVQVALIVALLAVVIAVPAAYALGRRKFRGQGLVSGLLLAPLMIGSVVIGVSLLAIMSRLGLWDTKAGLVIGHLVITLPFVVRLVFVGVQQLDDSLDRASATLGASRVRTFFSIVFPQLKPGIAAGAIFAFVLSMGEVAISSFLIGPHNLTLPVQVLTSIQFGADPTYSAASALMLVAAFAALILVERRFGLVDLTG